MRLSHFLRIGALLLALSSISWAQDAAQVLRTSVGFRTMKNTVPMDDATKQQVIELEKKATEANAAQKYGDALRYMAHGTALMRKQPWTPFDAFKTSLIVKAERLVFEPGETASVKLTRTFALEEPLAAPLAMALTLSHTREGKSERLKDLMAVPELSADFKQPTLIGGVLPADLKDGLYQLTLTLTAKSPSQSDAVISRIMAIRVQRDLLTQNQLLKTRLEDLQKTNGRPTNPRFMVIESNKTTSPFYLLSARAAYTASLIDLINAGDLPLERFNLSDEIANAHAVLDDITKGISPFYKKRGDIHWAYYSAVDNSPQPYRFFVPNNYDPAKKWPLVVALHGMGGNENSFFDSYNKGVIKEEAEKRGYLILCPKGRSPADMYLGNAQKDVFDSLAHLRQLYNIDEDRIYLMGHSMGGYGTWITAVAKPELFAALAPFSGGGIPPVMMGLKKIAHIPWFIVHGDADPTVNVEESRKMVKAGQELGAKVTYKEIPGGDHTNIVIPQFKEMFDFFDANKRQQPKAEAKAAGTGQ